MDEVVPRVPFAVGTQLTVVSSRVAHYSFDQFANMPALNRIALALEPS